jgi:hypothetical protein
MFLMFLALSVLPALAAADDLNEAARVQQQLAQGKADAAASKANSEQLKERVALTSIEIFSSFWKKAKASGVSFDNMNTVFDSHGLLKTQVGSIVIKNTDPSAEFAVVDVWSLGDHDIAPLVINGLGARTLEMAYDGANESGKQCMWNPTSACTCRLIGIDGDYLSLPCTEYIDSSKFPVVQSKVLKFLNAGMASALKQTAKWRN